jgi:hypothetical protein
MTDAIVRRVRGVRERYGSENLGLKAAQPHELRGRHDRFLAAARADRLSRETDTEGGPNCVGRSRIVPIAPRRPGSGDDEGRAIQAPT